LFARETSFLYVGDVFLNIVPLFHSGLLIPFASWGGNFICVVVFVAKKPLSIFMVQWCVVIPFAGTRNITTHNCAVTSLAGLL
jgi:hypothetical protein